MESITWRCYRWGRKSTSGEGEMLVVHKDLCVVITKES